MNSPSHGSSLRYLCILMLTCLLSAKPAFSIQSPGQAGDISCWLETSLKRIFPQSPAGDRQKLHLLTARNARISFQACFRNNSTSPTDISCTLEDAGDLDPQIRFVGLVPMRHFTPNTAAEELDGTAYLPGLVPDPLLPRTEAESSPYASRSFWITLNIPEDIRPGVHKLTVHLTYGEEEKQEIVLPVSVEISPLVIQPRKDFPVTHWWRGEATWDYYKTGMFDERWWELTRAQMQNLLEHGTDVAYIPQFFSRRETFKRPCQLLIVNETAPGQYTFNWSRVKRFTDMCKEIGFRKFEWTHLWIYWGLENPMRIYTQKGDGYEMLWPPDISGFSDTYVNFLEQFLPELHAFLIRENMLENSYFHVSDEPHGKHVENYRKARKILDELAPWMNVMDALSDIRYGREGLTDIPIPLLDAAQAYIDEGIPHWVYFCLAPQGPYLNRFMDTPLPKIRMSGWLFYRLGARGFLHWGYNYWHKIEQEVMTDPFTDGSADAYPIIPYGDPFVVYPGENGPYDSIRWEVFAESLQDYALLQSAGIAPEDVLLRDIHTYADFPKNEQWIRQAVEEVLRSAGN